MSAYGIQKLERGTTHPYRDTAVRLATALQLTPHDAERFYDAVEPVRRHSSPPRTPAALEERGRGLPVAERAWLSLRN
jgi:hypothetical protein